MIPACAYFEFRQATHRSFVFLVSAFEYFASIRCNMNQNYVKHLTFCKAKLALKHRNSKTCEKRPLSKRPKFFFEEIMSILRYFRPSLIYNLLRSLEWSFYTSFTAVSTFDKRIKYWCQPWRNVLLSKA